MDSLSGLVFLLLTVAIGYFAAKTRLIDPGATKILPQILFQICYPAMILETFSSIDTDFLLGSGLPVAVATVVITLILLFGCLAIFRKLEPEQRALYTFLAGVGNVTYVAIPMFQILLPPQAAVMAILHGSSQDPLIWAVYNPLLMGSQRKGVSLVELVCNPCLLATVAGLIMVPLGISLPPILLTTVSRISSITAPLAMLLIGMLICQYGLLSWLGDRKALTYTLIRVLVFPLVIGLCLLPFLEPVTAALLAILFATPGPLMAVAWATQADSQVEFTVHCFLASTLLYLGVMTPVLIWLAPYV